MQIGNQFTLSLADVLAAVRKLRATHEHIVRPCASTVPGECHSTRPTVRRAAPNSRQTGEARRLQATACASRRGEPYPRTRRTGPASCPDTAGTGGPLHKGPDEFMRDDQPKTGTGIIFALTDDAWNNIKVQVERTGIEIVIAEGSHLAGLMLPRDHVSDLHRALGRYLKGNS
jgi:hypothetical protein